MVGRYTNVGVQKNKGFVLLEKLAFKEVFLVSIGIIVFLKQRQQSFHFSGVERTNPTTKWKLASVVEFTHYIQAVTLPHFFTSFYTTLTD